MGRENMSLVAVFVLACLADPGNYAEVTVLECGALSVGGNTIVMYGVEPIDCAAVENALRGWLKRPSRWNPERRVLAAWRGRTCSFHRDL